MTKKIRNSIEFYSSSTNFSKSEFSNLIIYEFDKNTVFEFRQMNIQNRDNFFTAGAHAIKKIKKFRSCGRFKKYLSCLVPSKLSVLWSQLGMCLKENYSDSPSNEYLRHYSAEYLRRQNMNSKSKKKKKRSSRP